LDLPSERMSFEREHFPTTLSRDLLWLVCGAVIGQGCARTVYACKIDRSLVVKVEHEGGSFQNVNEWEVWNKMSDCAPAARWLAPCVAISSTGTILLQRRAEPIRKKELPKRVPAIFTDLKTENWGVIDGKPVCFDYGVHRAAAHAFIPMRKAEWAK
jgi:hypothetical protein